MARKWSAQTAAPNTPPAASSRQSRPREALAKARSSRKAAVYAPSPQTRAAASSSAGSCSRVTQEMIWSTAPAPTRTSRRRPMPRRYPITRILAQFFYRSNKSSRRVRAARYRPLRTAPTRPASHQDGAAVHHQDLTGAVGLAHQVEVGLGDLGGIADVADRRAGRDAAVERLAVGLCHLGPERRAHPAGRDDVDADRRQLDGERARQPLHGAADAGPERPAGARPQRRDAGGEDDRAAGPDAAAAVFRRREGAPVAQPEEAARRVEVRVRQAGELERLPD